MTKTVAEQLKESQDALAALKIDHTNLTTSLTTLTNERDTLKTANATLTTERDTARTERDTLTNERDTLKTANATLTTERDEAKSEVAKIPETVSRKLADHCASMNIPMPKSGVEEDKNKGGAGGAKEQPILKGRDLLQAGIRSQLEKQGLGNLSKASA